jgi:3-isopropylmalate/(R)-2-methylmalate dehydratase small subunit
MDKFVIHTGTGLPLRRSNVDTDQIIPSAYLKRVSRTGFEDGLFGTWRTDPEFILNRPDYQAASILVAGPEFGTGSSREHAVWALMQYGFRAVVSSRFADIFRVNCGKSGLLAAQVDESVTEQLWALLESDPTTPITLDLEAREVRAGALVATFDIDDYTRHCLLEGLDDIAITLAHEDAIASHEAARLSWMPTA